MFGVLMSTGAVAFGIVSLLPVELILQGLTRPVLDFHGKHFTFDNVPMELAPLQQPHPPIWYGVHAPDSAERAARRNLHVVSLDPPGMVRLAIERYRATWHAPFAGAPMPKRWLSPPRTA